MFGKTQRSWVTWWWFGPLLAGCAADLGSLSESGGQTGSLVPPTCEQESASPFVVPEGKTAFVEGWNEVVNPMLEDAAGNPVATSIVQDDDTSLVKTAESLAPGAYTLTYQCDGETQVEHEIIVVQSAPLPSSFGAVELVLPSPQPACDELEFITLNWTPDPAFLPYLNLVELNFSIDGADFGRVPLTRRLSADASGNVRVPIPSCRLSVGTCGLTSGTYRLHARIPENSTTWSSNDVAVADLCEPNGDPEDIGCSVRERGAKVRGPWLWLWPAIAIAVLVRSATGQRRKSRNRLKRND